MFRKYQAIKDISQVTYTADCAIVIHGCKPAEGGPEETLQLAGVRVADGKVCLRAAKFLVTMTKGGFTAEVSKTEPGTVCLHEPGTEFFTIGSLNDFIANPLEL